MKDQTKAAIEEAANRQVNSAGLIDTTDRANFFEGFNSGSEEVINNPERYSLYTEEQYEQALKDGYNQGLSDGARQTVDYVNKNIFK